MEVSGKKELISTPNPAYTVRYSQDQQVLTFLLASLSRDVLLQIHTVTTSSGVCQMILVLFASQSRACMIQLRGQLSTTRKGDLSAASYYTKMKGFTDELVAAGTPVDEDEVVSHILHGLDSDYNSFMSAISTRVAADNPIGLGELFSLLLSAETRIESQNTTEAHSLNLSSKGSGRGSSAHFPAGGGAPFHNSFGAAVSPPGGGTAHPQGPLVRQIRKLDGHGAWSCKKRFDKSFSNNPKRQGNRAKSANATATSYGVDTNWYLDTGATDHATGELEKLTVRDRYTVPEQIHTVSGQGMEIAHVGHALLPTPHESLKLNNILHVPTTSKSLLCGHQLTKDNDANLIVYPEFFSVNDQETGRTIIHCPSRGGLYPIAGQPATPGRQVLGVIKPSTSRWHRRLGHPSLLVVQQILRNHNLPVSSKTDHHLVCDACQMDKSHQLPYSRSPIVSHSPLELIFPMYGALGLFLLANKNIMSVS